MSTEAIIGTECGGVRGHVRGRSPVRLFLAVPISEVVRDGLRALQERLQRTEADVRWVAPDNFHLTVKFIGDQPDNRLPEIEAIGAELAARTDAFTIHVRGAGAFPKRGPLKTLWAGVGEGRDDWKALAQRAEAPLAAFGIAREGGLVPHITLGRVRSPERMEALRAALAAEEKTEIGRQAADRLVLVQSTLDPRGAVYKTVREWPLLVQQH